jgi:predicted DNA-binding transcriptional regulator YafY
VNRLERLLNLVAALLDADRPVSRHELTVLVPGYEGTEQAVRRSFERDKETLRAMGIPVVVEPLDPTNPEDGEGYRIPREQYELPDPGLAPDELAALHLAASLVQVEGTPGREALWKLGGAPTPSTVEGLVALRGDEHLPALFAAVGERRTVRFRYRDEERAVDPYRLSFRAGFWYLAGHDHGRGEERSFRLDRIQSPPVAGAARAFERPSAPPRRPPQPWEMGDEEAVEARVRVDATQASRVVEQLGDDAVVDRGADGSATVAVRVTNRAAFRSFVLGLLDHAEVLGPPELRADVVAWLRALAA